MTDDNIKSHESQGFPLILENTFLKKPQGEVSKIEPTIHLRVNPNKAGLFKSSFMCVCVCACVCVCLCVRGWVRGGRCLCQFDPTFIFQAELI